MNFFFIASSMHLNKYFCCVQNKLVVEKLTIYLNKKILNTHRFATSKYFLKGRHFYHCSRNKKLKNDEKHDNKKNSLKRDFFLKENSGLGKKKDMVNTNQRHIKEHDKEETKNNEKTKEKHKNSDWDKIKNLIDFTKKILISISIIYMMNNYIFDMTLTTGSSMYPLINTNGVVLFYICHDALVVFHKIYTVYIDYKIYVLNIMFFLINSISPFDNSGYYKNIIAKRIYKLKEQRKLKRNIYNRGDVVILYSPINNQKRVCKRIIALENDKIYIKHPNVYVQIPKNCVWVEGDNKEDSFDSRNYGSVPQNMLIGRVFFLIDPFTKYSFIKNKGYIVDKERFKSADS